MGASTALVALAAVFWGLSGGIGAILMNNDWDPFAVSFFRGALGLLCVLLWLMLHPKKSGLANRRLWFWSVIGGISVAGNFAFYFLSIAHGSVAVAATLMYCAPVFVFLLSFALKLERPTPAKWLAMVLVMVGVVLLTQLYDVGGSGVTAIGIGAGLLAGLSYAAFIFAFEYAAPHGSPQAILAIAFAVLAVILFWPSDTGQIVSALGSQDWPLFATLGVLGAGLSFVVYVIGLKNTPPAVASVVAMVEPVTATLFGVVVLHESLAGPQILGMALILVTATALSVYSSSEKSRPDAPDGEGAR
ncbi:DMT family transporter [Pseudomonas sp.]|uniref:DMT family transporter n=1 Tax=Pseudomonas sp. TaxID=306 RepID=UPI0028A94695|nr:DMT family transporter [Pseudomonas sp.]